MSQNPSLPLGGGRGFHKEGEGNRQIKGGGCKVLYVWMSTVRTDKVRCASSWISHPRFTSSQLPVILDPWLKVNKSPRAGMPEGQGLYLFKLVPRILIQTCCSFVSYILVRVRTYRNNVKGMVGWVAISHHCNFTVLHPDWCGSVGGVLSCKANSHQFDSQSGHMSRLWVQSLDGAL